MTESSYSSARTLRHMPETEAAWLAGSLNGHAVALLAKSRSAAPEPFAAAEHELVSEAVRLRFSDFARLNAYSRYGSRNTSCVPTRRQMM